MEYQFRDIEKKWQRRWKDTNAYKVSNESSRPKYYVLDMFPYPSGTGLHVGHPLGYIASDIYSRFKRLQGYNVLHPMGYDAFGLPAEQYAIEHGIHPADSTENNINNFRRQLDNIGFCFDWDREIRTSDASYYKWTQWIFLQLFHSFYDRTTQKASSVSLLTTEFEKNGNAAHPVPNAQFEIQSFSAEQWNSFNERTRQDILMEYRLAFCGTGEVNWCEALGTVLANDEVVNGVSERGGHPVVKKKLRQWYLRITAYADRLLEGLNNVEFSEAMKEMQTNWIGRSEGAEMEFEISQESGVGSRESGVGSQESIRVYTTRPDTIYGVDFMVLAPEHELVNSITTPEQKAEVEKYLEYVNSRSERERMSEKKISGVFTGAFAINPFSGKLIPVWISEYVLAGYGTGAIMAVPCGDQRDHAFARHFNIPITNIIGDHYNGEEANSTKEAILQQSGILDGMQMKEAIPFIINKVEEKGIGIRKVNYRMRDAAFSRQRYWGEPFPIKWVDGIAIPLDESELPLLLPHVDSYKPGPEGEGPLANIYEWTDRDLETNTMPGYAGSSWYFLRYMDPHNEQSFCARKVSDYWNQVDLYIGGTEHAVGHLLYSRMWTKALFDLGHIGFDEPYRRLLNQGMIQGSSRFIYRVAGKNEFVSFGLVDEYDTQALHVDVNMVDGVELGLEQFKKWRSGEYADASFILENGKYICGVETEKMSKSKFNTVNPDDLVLKYGADTFRMYEMFLGPVEVSKPWDTKGIEGVHRFLKKLWRLFFDEQKGKLWTDEKPTDAECKILHRTIKKINEDTERFSFNTAVSAFMICVNELSEQKCHKKQILEPLLILLTAYAPHIAEELYHQINENADNSVLDATFPSWDEKYLKETSKAYPVAINGKTRSEMIIDLNASQQEVEAMVMQDKVVLKWLDGKAPRKIIYVRNRMINIVI